MATMVMAVSHPNAVATWTSQLTLLAQYRRNLPVQTRRGLLQSRRGVPRHAWVVGDEDTHRTTMDAKMQAIVKMKNPHMMAPSPASLRLLSQN